MALLITENKIHQLPIHTYNRFSNFPVALIVLLRHVGLESIQIEVDCRTVELLDTTPQEFSVTFFILEKSVRDFEAKRRNIFSLERSYALEFNEKYFKDKCDTSLTSQRNI